MFPNNAFNYIFCHDFDILQEIAMLNKKYFFDNIKVFFFITSDVLSLEKINTLFQKSVDENISKLKNV